MSAYKITDEKGQVSGIITFANIFDFEGFVFEFHEYLGPTRLKKGTLEPSKIAGEKFWAAFERWNKLSKEEKVETQIFG